MSSSAITRALHRPRPTASTQGVWRHNRVCRNKLIFNLFLSISMTYAITPQHMTTMSTKSTHPTGLIGLSSLSTLSRGVGAAGRHPHLCPCQGTSSQSAPYGSFEARQSISDGGLEKVNGERRTTLRTVDLRKGRPPPSRVPLQPSAHTGRNDRGIGLFHGLPKGAI